MFIPSKYKITDEAIISRFIQANGFATLITGGPGTPQATHIPVELEVNAAGKEVLWGHIARANPQWQVFEEHPEVLVTFMSDLHQYISSSWYNFPEAPTWNYMSVHVSGKIRILDEEQKWESVRRLTDRYEQGNPNPVSLDALPENVQRQMNGIVAFEIEISKREAVFKMSQNRDEENFQHILLKLRESKDIRSVLVADIMENIRKGLN
jgi:transcriptional regulator